MNHRSSNTDCNADTNFRLWPTTWWTMNFYVYFSISDGGQGEYRIASKNYKLMRMTACLLLKNPMHHTINMNRNDITLIEMTLKKSVRWPFLSKKVVVEQNSDVYYESALLPVCRRNTSIYPCHCEITMCRSIVACTDQLAVEMALHIWILHITHFTSSTEHPTKHKLLCAQQHANCRTWLARCGYIANCTGKVKNIPTFQFA